MTRSALFAAIILGAVATQTSAQDYPQDEAYARIGEMTLVGDIAGRDMDVWIDDEVVYSGFRDPQLEDAPFRVRYSVSMFPTIVAVSIRGCAEPAIMEMTGPSPVILIQGCEIGMYVERV